MSFLIKICGVTTPEDAEMVGRAGADAIGLNFWPGSKRFVGERAAEILAAIPNGVLRFGVFVNASSGEVSRTADHHRLDRIQLHGDERAADFRQLPREKLVRALRVRDLQSMRESAEWSVDLFLFDAFVDGYGGGGGGVGGRSTAPWGAIARYTSSQAFAAPGRARALPFLLAGGLHPGNVAAAIAATGPDGVDVASGVEHAPGLKSRRLVEEFIAAARAASSVARRPPE